MEACSALDDYLAARGLRPPAGLRAVYGGDLSDRLSGLLFVPRADGDATMGWAESAIDASEWPLLPNLVPMLPVDERSFACVVASDADGEPLPGEGAVVRWHIGLERDAHQAALLDTDCLEYARSVADELSARDAGLQRMLDEIGPAYLETHIDKQKRPRTFVVRPIRVACQNVIVGLAAIAQDAGVDGLSVPAWQTCEVPHVATHEANRALAVITLCDAFQNGGTMEIRFDREAAITLSGKRHRYPGHPERAVPASLRRFARTVGVAVGEDDPAAISPREARELFVAVTPMDDDLSERVTTAIATLGIKPERLCYTLLKPIWRQIELDWLLAVSPRVASILEGGADWHDRSARQAESEACRTALMAGMLFRRLDATDAAGAGGRPRVVEDRRRGVTWSVEPEHAAIRFANLPPELSLPWTSETVATRDGELLVAFSSCVTATRLDALAAAAGDDVAVLAVPRGVEVPVDAGARLVVARCPDRLADLDKTVEANLTSARISRA